MGPHVRFYRLFESAQKPILADKSAHGLLPTRAFRFCEAARVASSLGWYVFPPVAFSIVYDGAATHWCLDGDDWSLLDDVVLEAEASRFDSACPDELIGHCPPLVGAAENGMLQITTGLAVTTPKEWGVLVRRPPNIPQKHHVEYFEGFVETGSWFGPLFINLRPLKTDVPVRFVPDWPLAFVQPLPVELTEPDLFQNTSYASELDEITDEDWSRLENTLVGRTGSDREVARYAKNIRKAHR